MLEILTGVLLGLSLAAPPGPVTALMADATLRRRALAGMVVGLGATCADFVFFLVAWAGAVAVLVARPTVLAAVSLAGAGLLAWYALGAWRAARAADARPPSAPAGFAAGFLAAATSPFNLAWWVGPGSVLIASVGLLLVAGLFAGVLAWVAFFPAALAAAGGRVRGLQRAVSYASAVVLAGFALWIGWRGAWSFLGALGH